MKSKTKAKLLDAWIYCDEQDKSTEFMIEYMKNMAQVDHDTVMNYLEAHKGVEAALEDFYKEMAKEYAKDVGITKVLSTDRGGIVEPISFLYGYMLYADRVLLEKQQDYDRRIKDQADGSNKKS